jgi:hypothetical protein
MAVPGCSSHRRYSLPTPLRATSPNPCMVAAVSDRQPVAARPSRPRRAALCPPGDRPTPAAPTALVPKRWPCGASSEDAGRALGVAPPFPWVGDRGTSGRGTGGRWWPSTSRAGGCSARTSGGSPPAATTPRGHAWFRRRTPPVPAGASSLGRGTTCERVIGGRPWFVRAAEHPLIALSGDWEARRSQWGVTPSAAAPSPWWRRRRP